MNENENDKTILFVCTGNTCRSPMAELLFRHRLGPDGGWTALSAGVAALPGCEASPEAKEVLAEMKVDASEHRSSPVSREWVDRATLIAAMTEGHRAELLAQYPDAADKVRLLTEFGTGGRVENIADPIGQSVGVYRYTRDQIDRAIADLILYIRERWGLAGPPETKGT